MGRDDLVNDYLKSKIQIIFDQLSNFKDSDGYYYWAIDKEWLFR